MFAYIGLAFVALFTSLERVANLRLLFSFLMLAFAALLLGLRDASVGIDTEEYHWIFFLANERPWHHYITNGLEPLFIFSNKLFGFLGFNASWFIFTVSILTVFSVAIFIHRYSPSLLLSWVCFLGYGQFFQFHNTMRQSIALAILLLSIPYILKRKFLTFSLFVFLAAGFHYSAIVFMVFYFLYNLRVNSVVLVFAWLFSLLFIIKASLFIAFLDMMSWAIPSAYLSLIDDGRIVSFGGQGIGIRLIALQFVLFIKIYLYRCFLKNKALSCFEKRSAFFLLAGICAIILGNVFYHVGLISRLLHYFSIFLLVSIPLIPFAFKRNERIFVTSSFCFFLITLYFRALLTDPHGVFPYSTFAFVG